MGPLLELVTDSEFRDMGAHVARPHGDKYWSWKCFTQIHKYQYQHKQAKPKGGRPL
jgi:hypothetical protein